MNKRIIIISTLFAFPFFASADGFVNCGIDNPNTCGYKDLIDLIQKVINYLIYTLATPIAALLIGYTGFQMITSGGDTGKYKKAKDMFKNILIGYVVMLSAFLIIKLIFSLIFPADYSLLS